MAVVKKWQVNTCKRDLSDGFIKKVIYRLKAIENNIEIENTRQTGEVTFTKPSSLPSDFIPYKKAVVDSDGNITEAGTPDHDTIIGWVKAKINLDATNNEYDKSVAERETIMDNAITLAKTSVTEDGTPWDVLV